MTFKVPKSEKDESKNRFEFEGPRGEKHSLPLLEYLPIAAAEAFEQGQEVRALILGADNKQTQAFIRALDSKQFDALMEAWEAASKVTPGESAASS